MEYRFNGNGQGLRIYFESRESLAAKSAIPCIYIGKDRNGDENAYLDMIEMATRNMEDHDVVLFGGGTVGKSGEFSFSASKFKDGSYLYAVVHELGSLLMGPSLAAVGVYAYDGKREDIEGVMITEELFAEPTEDQRDMDDGDNGRLVAKAKAELHNILANVYHTVTPLAHKMAADGCQADPMDISPESLAKLLKLLN